MKLNKLTLTLMALILTLSPLKAAFAAANDEMVPADDTVTTQPDDAHSKLTPAQKKVLEMYEAKKDIETARLQLSLAGDTLAHLQRVQEHGQIMLDWTITAQQASKILAGISAVRGIVRFVTRRGISGFTTATLNGKIFLSSTTVALLAEVAKRHFASEIILTFKERASLSAEIKDEIGQLAQMEVAYDALYNLIQVQ